ncbi:hypothetical protein ACH4KU_33170 [Streptomyces althioticus]|uniref:hypothetical protein n=1 Tax=Streptomyces althioticus TaxID=83380 RepID=UPI0037BCAA15
MTDALRRQNREALAADFRRSHDGTGSDVTRSALLRVNRRHGPAVPRRIACSL